MQRRAVLKRIGAASGAAIGIATVTQSVAAVSGSLELKDDEILVGEEVRFSAHVSADTGCGLNEENGEATSYIDYGDGTTERIHEFHDKTYSEPGTYTIKLYGCENCPEYEDTRCVVVDSETITVLPRRIEVDIDIKPGSDPNAINPESKGTIPVAVIHSDSFDPVERVDVSSLRFGAPSVVENGGGATAAHGGHSEDVTGDGETDLVVHFPTADTGFERDDSMGKLVGKTTDGTPLFGSDSVKIAGR